MHACSVDCRILDSIVGHHVVLLATISPLSILCASLRLLRSVRRRFRSVLLVRLLPFRHYECTYARFRRYVCGIAFLVIGKNFGFVQPVFSFRPSAPVVEAIPC